jgi:hypothetical protein
MLNGSFSLMRLLWVVLLVVLRDELVWPQKLLRSSPGDGGKQRPESLISEHGKWLAKSMLKRSRNGYLPLNLYSAACFSARSIDFGGAVALLEVFSTMPEVGRAFSSCLRNGLRMMGILANN